MIYAKPPIGAMLDWGCGLARGLIGWWPLLEGGGAWLHDAGPHANRATVVGLPWAYAATGRVLLGSGTDGEHAIAASLRGPFSQTGLTTAAVVTNHATSGDRAVLGCAVSGKSVCGGFTLRTRTATGGNACFEWYGTRDEAGGDVAEGTAVAGPTWLVATVDGSYVTLYQAGRCIARVARTQSFWDPVTSIALYLGATWTAGQVAEEMDGALIAAALWGRPLTAAEVADLEREPFGAFGPRAWTYALPPSLESHAITDLRLTGSASVGHDVGLGLTGSDAAAAETPVWLTASATQTATVQLRVVGSGASQATGECSLHVPSTRGPAAWPWRGDAPHEGLRAETTPGAARASSLGGRLSADHDACRLTQKGQP